MQHATTRGRETWIDVAKGVAILLVVFFHSVLYPLQIGLGREWVKFSYTLDTFRMPLFFFVSGLLASRVVRGSFENLFRRRMVRLLYLYVVWCTLQRLFIWALPPSSLTPAPVEPLALLTIFTSPHPNLWFIYALPLYLAVAWLVRELPSWVVIVGAALVSATFAPGLLPLGTGPWGKTGRYFFFFILATYLSDRIRGGARHVRLPHLFVSGAVYAAAALSLVLSAGSRFPFSVLVAGLLAVTFGTCLAVMLSRTGLRRLLEFLGQRTLPIYLVHTFPLILVAALLRPHLAELSSWVGLVLPPVLTVLAVTFGLLADRYLRKIPGLIDVPVRSWTQVRSGAPAAVHGAPGTGNSVE